MTGASSKHAVSQIVTSSLAVVALGFAASGCAEPLVGAWETVQKSCGEYDSLEIDDDLRGSARIYFAVETECYYADFEVDVLVREDADYELILRAEERELSDLDFRMRCELEDDDSRLDCSGGDLFADFEWKWERD